MKVGVLVESMGAGGGKAMPDLEQVNFFSVDTTLWTLG